MKAMSSGARRRFSVCSTPPGDDRAEVGLVVGVVVPHQRGDAVAALEPRLRQRLGQQARALVEVGVRVAVQRLVRHARDDLLRAEQLARPLQKMRQIERDAHHRGLHFTPPAPRLRARLFASTWRNRSKLIPASQAGLAIESSTCGLASFAVTAFTSSLRQPAEADRSLLDPLLHHREACRRESSTPADDRDTGA